MIRAMCIKFHRPDSRLHGTDSVYGPTGPLVFFELGYVHHGRPTPCVSMTAKTSWSIPQIHRTLSVGFRVFVGSKQAFIPLSNGSIPGLIAVLQW